MFNKIIKTIRARLFYNPRNPENLTRFQEIVRSIGEQGTNPVEGQFNRLTKKGLTALELVISTKAKKLELSESNSGSFSSRSRSPDSISSRSRSQGSISSIQSVSLRDIESRNDAIIEKLNFLTVKILIAISSLAGNTLYLNNTIITSASFISIFQITLFIFFNCINKIESMRDNDLITEIDINIFLKTNDDNNIDMIGGAVYNKKYVLEIINILINAKSIQYRNAILYLFACIFVFVLLKKHEKYYSELKISGGGNKSQAKRNNMSKKHKTSE
jgi:hypothetical protein